MGFWKEFFSNLDEPAIIIRTEERLEIHNPDYNCDDCGYEWTSRKRVGTPCRCPDCGSKNIKEDK